MVHIWRRILDMLTSLTVPALSDTESHAEPLSAPEINLVFQWLRLLKSFFNAKEDGVENGVPISTLQSGVYKDLLLIGSLLDLSTPALKEKCVAAIKGAGRSKAPVQRKGSFISAGVSSMGRAEDQDERSAELLLRVLRMKPGTAEFLKENVSAFNQARVQRQNNME